VASDLAKYKLHLMEVQEVRWDKGGNELAENYIFSHGNGNTNDHFRFMILHKSGNQELRG
jgi:hypothetical protein